MKLRLRGLTLGLVLLVMISGACKKKVPPPPPPPPPPPAGAAPSASLTADPTTIQRGQSTNLRWSSQNANELDLEPGIGPVEPQGARSAAPGQSTTYTLTARGPGGSTQATVRVTVAAATATSNREPAQPPPSTAGIRERFEREVKDAFFDFDKADIRDDARSNLMKSADFFKANPTITFVIEGHSDERGSAAYNLGLGDRRANAVKDFLGSLGIQAERMKPVSYGKEQPFCTEHDESCWQLNRRGHLVCENCGQ